MPFRSRLPRTLLTIVITVLGSALLLEALLRWLLPNPNLQLEGMYQLGSNGIGLTPGWYGRARTNEFDVLLHINRLGLRDASDGPLPDKQHVVVLGDSFAFGCWAAVDATWLRWAQDQIGPQVQILNAGNPNFGTDAELNFLLTHAADLQPQVIVLAFYNGNDFYDNMVGWGAYTVEDGFLIMQPDATARWKQYNCVGSGASIPQDESRWNRAVPPCEAGPPPQPPRSVAGERPRWVRHSSLYQMFSMLRSARSTPSTVVRPFEPEAWFLRGYTKEMTEATDRTFGLLEAVSKKAIELHAPLVVVDIPARSQVIDAAWTAFLQRHRGLSASLFDRDKPRRLLSRWARARGVPFLDLAPVLRPSQKTYYRRDMHWNALGHRLAGEELGRFLREVMLAGNPHRTAGSR